MIESNFAGSATDARIRSETVDGVEAAADAQFGGSFEDGRNEQEHATAERRRQRVTRAPHRLPQGFFAPADIAAYMGMSTYRVQELCRRGELRHVKDGRSIRIRKEWADRFMADRESEPLR